MQSIYCPFMLIPVNDDTYESYRGRTNISLWGVGMSCWRGLKVVSSVLEPSDIRIFKVFKFRCWVPVSL